MTIDPNNIVRARDVMDPKLIFIDGMATAAEAADMMRREQALALLVEKRHPDDVWGIMVVQDIIRGVLVAGREAAEVNVYEIMSKPVIPIPADMDIRYASRMLFNAGVRRAPVEDKGELVGMLSLSSLILNNRLF